MASMYWGDYATATTTGAALGSAPIPNWGTASATATSGVSQQAMIDAFQQFNHQTDTGGLVDMDALAEFAKRRGMMYVDEMPKVVEKDDLESVIKREIDRLKS